MIEKDFKNQQFINNLVFKLNTLNLQLMLISRSAVMDHSPNISPEFDQNSLAQF